VRAPWFDHGGGERRGRHVDVGFATGELVAEAPRVTPRVNRPTHAPTVVHVPWARHRSGFSRAFEDLVVFDAIVSSRRRRLGEPNGEPRAANTDERR
jgi:hypothetical protein